MTLQADKVRVALTGAIYVADLDTQAPATPAASWPAGWTDLGWISEDGVTEAYEDDVQDIVGWQGGATVRKVITGSDATFSFTCIETNPTVLELYHKGSELEDLGGGASKMEIKSAQPDERSFGIDVVDGENVIRIIIPRGEVTERGEITYVGSEAVAYEMTVTAYPDDEGVVAIKLSDAFELEGS